MSKLYLVAETDMIRTLRTARAKDWISVWLHFDEKHPSRSARIRMYRDDDKEDRFRVITIGDKEVCRIDRKTGIMECHIDGKYDLVDEKWIDG